MIRIMVLLTLVFAIAPVWAADVEWNPYRDNEFQNNNKNETRSYVRGSKLEMGEIVSIEGSNVWVKAEAGTDVNKKADVRVGDKIYMGSVVSTDNDTVVEILLGFNARIRLGAGTIVKMDNISVDEDKNLSLTNRKIILDRGSIRARVKQNTVTPTPVLVISVAAEMAVGLPDLAVEGGVDILVEKDKNQKEAVVKVLNGSIKMERKSGMLGKKEESRLDKGNVQVITPEGSELPVIENMDKLEIFKVMKEYSFTTEAWGQVSHPPSGRNEELDGP